MEGLSPYFIIIKAFHLKQTRPGQTRRDVLHSIASYGLHYTNARKYCNFGKLCLRHVVTFVYMFRSPVLRQHTEHTVVMLSPIQDCHIFIPLSAYLPISSSGQITRQQTIAKLVHINDNQ